ncbi:MAG: DUF5305 domain-containing protein, partial [Oscillochloris sp.]|nr:DUF5305 domain-containing protein [Oscillochloris sp.]
IVIEGDLAGAPLRDSFAPRLEFDIDALQIQLLTGQGGTDVLRPVQAGEIRLAGVGPNSMSILGLQLDVALAREGGLIAAVVAAGLAAMAALPLLWSARSSEHARIALRYGAMMIDVADQPSLRAARVVRIGSFGDLAKLAERHGALIMRDGPALAPRYIVQQGDTAYIYGALAPEATAPPAAAEPAPSAAPDPAEAPDPGVTQLWQERFLQALRESGMAADACRSIGVDIVTAYRERERSSEFAQAWNDARLTAWQQRTLKGQSR